MIKKLQLAAPRWLQRMLLQLQQYDLNVVYVPVSQQVVADTLSRAPVEAAPKDTACRDEVIHLGLKDAVFKELKVISERDFIPISDMRLTAVEAAKKDVEQTELRKVISNGWPNKMVEVPEDARKYWNFREVFTTQDGVIYKENMPSQAKQDIRAHEIPEQPWAKNVPQLRSFLGLVNFYGKFLHNLADTLAPLHQLLRKNERWHWGQQQGKAFEKAKSQLTSPCVLTHFDPDKRLVLSCDASPYGLGAVLAHQFEDGSERPVAFASRSLAPAERKYSQIEKEGCGLTRRYVITFLHTFLWILSIALTHNATLRWHVRQYNCYFFKMAAVDPYAQAVAKISDRIDKAHDEIAKTFQEIKAIKNSDAYKAVSMHFVDGKAITGTSEEVKASWCYFQSQLSDLTKEIDLLRKQKTSDEIAKIFQKIEAIKNSDAYKAVSMHFVDGKAITGTSEEVQASWCYFQSQLSDLTNQKDLLTMEIDLLTKQKTNDEITKQKTNDEIAKIFQKIEAIKNSDDYKAVSKRFPWGKATTGTSKDDEASWCCYTSQLEDLTKQLNFYLSQNAVAFKKTDEVRKGYKRSTAARSERQVLTSFALFIAERYNFQRLYEKSVTFGDVMAAVGFHGNASIHQYFKTKVNENRKYTAKEEGATPIEDLLSEKTWCYLVLLNDTVNRHLHEPLEQDSNNKVTVVLESGMYYPDYMEEVTKLMGFVNVDIKNGDSDSGSDKGSP
eukprot:Em0009g459a